MENQKLALPDDHTKYLDEIGILKDVESLHCIQNYEDYIEPHQKITDNLLLALKEIIDEEKQNPSHEHDTKIKILLDMLFINQNCKEILKNKSDMDLDCTDGLITDSLENLIEKLKEKMNKTNNKRKKFVYGHLITILEASETFSFVFATMASVMKSILTI